jgi:Amt family ammonium transporter
VLIFMVLWFTFSYIPMAHMVWYWAGPDAFTSAEAAAKAGVRRLPVQQGRPRLCRRHGGAHQRRRGRAGGCLMVGPRIGYRRESMAPTA